MTLVLRARRASFTAGRSSAMLASRGRQAFNGQWHTNHTNRKLHCIAGGRTRGRRGIFSCSSSLLEELQFNLQRYQQQQNLRMGTSTISSWLRDVVQSKSLQPKNPILESVKSARSGIELGDNQLLLPQFSYMLPYHLESAAQEVIQQYHEELAQLEVSLTATSAAIPDPYPNRSSEEIMRIIRKLDRLEAPIHQVLQVGHMLSQLTDDHEDLKAWQKAHDKVQEMILNNAELRSSYILYNSLVKSRDTGILPPRLLHSFCAGGAEYHDTVNVADSMASTSSTTMNETREQLQEIQNHILQLRHRILSMDANFMALLKPSQLQTLSDLYQIIGLTWQQARLLGYNTVGQMELDNTNNGSNSKSHMLASTEQIHDLHQQVMEVTKPYAKQQVAQLDQSVLQEVGLGGSAGGGDNKMADRRRQHQEKEQRRLLWHARHAIKQYLTLDGVLEGLSDWTEAIMGISVKEVVDDGGDSDGRVVTANNIYGWQQNVRLFNVYHDLNVSGKAQDADRGTTAPVLLGSFYLDPYERSAKPRTPKTWLFSQRASQSTAPVVIMSLCMDSPAWNDDPTLLTWDMTRSLLHQFGKALQLILSASAASPYRIDSNIEALSHSPEDISEFLPYFMEMWLHNDGFVQRLAQLSQDEYDSIPLDLLLLLRKDWASQKIEDWRHQIFLGELELAIWNDFDPLNKQKASENSKASKSSSSLGALQQELAEIYTPNNIPSSQDLSPLLEIFQQSRNTANRTVDHESHMTVHAQLWSELLSANVYAAFQDALTIGTSGNGKAKGQDGAKDQVEKLGVGVRELFLPSSPNHGTLSSADFETLCGKKISPQALEEVYNLSALNDE